MGNGGNKKTYFKLKRNYDLNGILFLLNSTIFYFYFFLFFLFFLLLKFLPRKNRKKTVFFYTKVGFLIKSFIKRSLLKGIVGIPLISPVSMFVLNVFKRLRGLMKLLIQQLVV